MSNPNTLTVRFSLNSDLKCQELDPALNELKAAMAFQGELSPDKLSFQADEFLTERFVAIIDQLHPELNRFIHAEKSFSLPAFFDRKNGEQEEFAIEMVIAEGDEHLSIQQCREALFTTLISAANQAQQELSALFCALPMMQLFIQAKSQLLDLMTEMKIAHVAPTCRGLVADQQYPGYLKLIQNASFYHGGLPHQFEHLNLSQLEEFAQALPVDNEDWYHSLIKQWDAYLTSIAHERLTAALNEPNFYLRRHFKNYIDNVRDKMIDNVFYADKEADQKEIIYYGAAELTINEPVMFCG